MFLRGCVIDKETRAALQANTVRFLLRASHAIESRHSSDIIPWARNYSERLTEIVAIAAGRKPTHFALQLNVIRLPDHQSKAFICCDLFLHECDEGERNQFSQNTQQPIHEVGKRGDSCHVIRRKKMDSIVAEEYRHLQEIDHGPRPYFVDERNPPLYVDGRRVEKSKGGIPDPNELKGDKLKKDESKADELKVGELKKDESKGDELKKNRGE
jgi:hypothetical protein